MKLSVVVVSYNCYPFLAQCLESIYATRRDFDLEVFVFDNASTDETQKMLPATFPKIRYEFSKVNLGFAKANNRAIEQCEGDLVLILNPDVLLPEDFFELLLDKQLLASDFGIIGPRMLDFFANFHPESKRRVPDIGNTFSKLFGSLVGMKSTNYYHNELGEEETGEVEILAGACMLVKRKAFLEIGGFDERYFMYGEDVDLSYTFWQKGYTNLYNGKARLLHYKGQSSRKDVQYFKQFFRAMHLFIDKYYWERPISYYLLKFGAYARYLVARVIYLFQTKKNAKPDSHKDATFFYPKTASGLRKGNCVLEFPIFGFSEILEILEENSHQSEIHFWIKTPNCPYLVRPNATRFLGSV